MTRLNIAALARWRAEAWPDEARCIALFGVGPATLQRIEAGEVEPGDDLAERIGRFLEQLPDPSSPSSSLGTGMDGGNSTPASSKGGVGDFLGGARPKLNAALHRKGVERELIKLLRDVPTGAKPHLGDIRRAIAAEGGACAQADLRQAIERLRCQGKLHWSRLELSASMLSDRPLENRGPPLSKIHPVENPDGPPPDAGSPVPAPQAEADSAADADPASNPKAPPEPGPLVALDAQGGGDLGLPGSVTATHSNVAQARAIRRSGAARAASRRVPGPVHESEVARAVREEADAMQDQRNAARGGGVRRVVTPISLTEVIQSALADTPSDLMCAINRRHKAMWGRILLLGRATGQRPSQALYDVLEAGLTQLEPEIPQQEARHAA